MRAIRIGALGLIGVAAFAVGAAACTAGQAKTALDVAGAACVIANAEKASAEILALCKFEQAAAPAVVAIVESFKVERARHAGKPCAASAAPDAGGGG